MNGAWRKSKTRTKMEAGQSAEALQENGIASQCTATSVTVKLQVASCAKEKGVLAADGRIASLMAVCPCRPLLRRAVFHLRFFRRVALAVAGTGSVLLPHQYHPAMPRSGFDLD